MGKKFRKSTVDVTEAGGEGTSTDAAGVPRLEGPHPLQALSAGPVRLDEEDVPVPTSKTVPVALPPGADVDEPGNGVRRFHRGVNEHLRRPSRDARREELPPGVRLAQFRHRSRIRPFPSRIVDPESETGKDSGESRRWCAPLVGLLAAAAAAGWMAM